MTTESKTELSFLRVFDAQGNPHKMRGSCIAALLLGGSVGQLWPDHGVVIRAQFLARYAGHLFNAGAVFNRHNAATLEPIANRRLPSSANQTRKLCLTSGSFNGFVKCFHVTQFITFVIAWQTLL